MNIINIKNDILLFKDETLKNLRNIENNLIEKLKLKDIEINSKILDFDSKLNEYQTINKNMYKSVLEQQVNLENIKNIFEFKSKLEERMISLDYKLNSYISDLKNIRNKYDKMFSDNLTVPGIIGASCRYKTISQYINDNINIVDQLKKEEDVIKKEVSEIIIKNDFMEKNLNFSIDDSISTCKLYADTRVNQVKIYFQERFDILSNNINNAKNEIEDNIIKSQEIRNSIKNDIKGIKEEINNLIIEKNKDNKIIKNEIKKCQNNEIRKELNEIQKNFIDLKLNMEKDIMNSYDIGKSKSINNNHNYNLNGNNNLLRKTKNSRNEIKRKNQLSESTHIKVFASDKNNIPNNDDLFINANNNNSNHNIISNIFNNENNKNNNNYYKEIKPKEGEILTGEKEIINIENSYNNKINKDENENDIFLLNLTDNTNCRKDNNIILPEKSNKNNNNLYSNYIFNINESRNKIFSKTKILKDKNNLTTNDSIFENNNIIDINNSKEKPKKILNFS